MSDTKQLAFSAAQIDAILAAAARCSNRNLLDNWDFRAGCIVNQRGVSGTISAAGYFIDRWKLISGTVTITVNGLTLNGTIRQIRENSAGATTTASVDMYSGAATITYNDTTKYCDITSGGGTIARCKLELGSISTLANDPPADYGEELRKCQRYYFQNAWATLKTSYCNDNEITTTSFQFPVQMRTFPAISPLVEQPIYNLYTFNFIPGFFNPTTTQIHPISIAVYNERVCNFRFEHTISQNDYSIDIKDNAYAFSADL